MTTAGLATWETASAGENTKGWIVLHVKSRSDAYPMEDKRLAASVSGRDPIDEKIFTVDLPTS